MKVSDEEIEAKKSEKGGWTKATLALWGVPWPPPKGWRESLIKGTPLAEQTFSTGAMRGRHIGGADAKLLHLVTMAVIENGHGDILAEIPGLNEYYGGELPTVADIIGGEKIKRISGEVELTDKVYRFTCIRDSK